MKMLLLIILLAVRAAGADSADGTHDSFPTLAEAFKAANQGTLVITKKWVMTEGITIAGSLIVRCAPGAQILASRANFTMFTVKANDVSFDGCTLDGNFPAYSGVNPISASQTAHFGFTNGVIRNVFGTGILVSGNDTSDLHIAHNQFINFGNGAVAIGTSDCIKISDFTSATIDDNYFRTNTSGNFIYAANKLPGKVATLTVMHNRGSGFAHVAFEVQMYGSGIVTSLGNKFDTALNANAFCISLGIVNGSTPSTPVLSGSSSTDDRCATPDGLPITRGYGFEVYINGMSVKGLQVIGPWGQGMDMGSKSLRVSDSLFDHNLTAILENGTNTGTGYHTDHLRMTNVVINEPRDQGLNLCGFDCSGDILEGVHIYRTPYAWAGDSARIWFGMGWGGSAGNPIASPFQVLHSTVTFNAPLAGSGFRAYATGITGANHGASFDGLQVDNLGSKPFGTAHFENRAGLYNNHSILNAVYTNLEKIGNYAPTESITYANNKCLQGANPKPCGAPGGPATDGTVTPVQYANRGPYAPGTTNFCSDCRAFSDGSLAEGGPGAQVSNLNGILVGQAVASPITGCTREAPSTSACTTSGSQQAGTVAFTTTGPYASGSIIVTLGINTFSSVAGSPFCVVQWTGGESAASSGTIPGFRASPTALGLVMNGPLPPGSYSVSWSCR